MTTNFQTFYHNVHSHKRRKIINKFIYEFQLYNIVNFVNYIIYIIFVIFLILNMIVKNTDKVVEVLFV